MRIPVTILTGFLGSGKTTLLNAALASPLMARTAVVINEYGEVGIDHALTTASDDTITVLDNGCLCCTVFGDLIGTLNRLYHAREAGKIMAFDRMVIETSGLADPRPVLQAFLSEPTLAGLYRVDAVVATIDAVNGPATLDDYAESIHQAAVASAILVTKLDLLSAETGEARRQDLSARLRRINPAATLIHADQSGLDPVALLRSGGDDPLRGGRDALAWLNADAYAAEHMPCDAEPDHAACDHPHSDGIAAYCLVREEPSSRAALELLLAALERNLGPNLLRVKGLVHVAGHSGGPAVIQGAQHLLHNLVFLDRWPDEDRRTRIVFITHNIEPAILEEMVTMLERIAARTAGAQSRAQAQRDAPAL